MSTPVRSVAAPILVEACVSSVPEARAAESAGADRLELCGPGDGGSTPSRGLVEAVLATVRVPVHVMIRPHAESFVLSTDWVDVMRRDMASLLGAGAAGVVCGVLTPDAAVDRVALEALLDAAAGAPVVFHRAFDRLAQPERALDLLCELGVAGVLTSGASDTAAQGAHRLRSWQAQVGNRLAIIAGGGVRAGSVGAILDTAPLRAVHARATDAGVFRQLVEVVRARV